MVSLLYSILYSFSFAVLIHTLILFSSLSLADKNMQLCSMKDLTNALSFHKCIERKSFLVKNQKNLSGLFFNKV